MDDSLVSPTQTMTATSEPLCRTLAVPTLALLGPLAKSLINRRLRADALCEERDALKMERDQLHRTLAQLQKAPMYVPPGHYYSPIPCPEEIARDEARIFDTKPRE